MSTGNKMVRPTKKIDDDLDVDISDETGSDTYGDIDTHSDDTHEVATQTTSIKPKSKILFMAEFTDGYSFRAMIEFLKTSLSKAKFIFSDDGISLIESDSSMSMLIKISIKADEMTHYEYHSANPVEYFGFELGNIRNTTNNIGKKDSFRIWNCVGDRKLYMQNMSRKNTSSESCDYISRIDIPLETFKGLPEFEGKPNCKIISSEFAEMCKSMGAKKCNYVLALGFPHGVIFKAVTGSEISGRSHKFGDVRSKKDDVRMFDPNRIEEMEIGYDESNLLCNVMIKKDTIKALSKIGNFIPGGNNIVQTYMGYPILIRSKIGSYGDIEILLKCCRTANDVDVDAV
jgi:hypothetical protein